MTEFSLHQWLQSEQAAGTLDSEGEFTLVQSKAWEKLGAFQLPFPEAWVLKLVQAALSTERTELAIVQSREETRFDFSQAPDWNPLEVEKAIFDTSYRTEKSLNHLVIAIRSLALKKTRPFSLRYFDGSQISWNGSSFTTHPEAGPRPGCFTLTVANYEFRQSKHLFSTASSQAATFRANIAKALSDHCHLARHRVTLDGRRPDCYLADPDFGLTNQSQPLCVLKAAPVADWDPLTVVGEFYFQRTQLGYKRIETSISTPGERSIFSVGAVLTLFYEAELLRESLQLDRWLFGTRPKRSQILWYSDGVIVSREPLEFEATVGLGLILSAQNLATDLTGFNPLETAEKQNRISASLNLIRQELDHFRDSLRGDLFAVKGLSGESKVSTAFGTALAFGVPMIGIPWMLATGYKVSKQVKENRELAQAFNQGFTQLIEFLQSFKGF